MTSTDAALAMGSRNRDSYVARDLAKKSRAFEDLERLEESLECVESFEKERERESSGCLRNLDGWLLSKCVIHARLCISCIRLQGDLATIHYQPCVRSRLLRFPKTLEDSRLRVIFKVKYNTQTSRLSPDLHTV